MPHTQHHSATCRGPIEVSGPILPDEFAELLRTLNLEAYATRIAGKLLRNTEEALDVVQESLVALAQSLDKGTRIVNVMAFIAATVRNKARSVLRNRYRHGGTELEAAADASIQPPGQRSETFEQCRCVHTDSELLIDLADPRCSHEDIVMFSELVETALGMVSETMRRAFEAVAYEGKTREEVAQLCGCDTGSVSRWIRRILETIRQLAKR